MKQVSTSPILYVDKDPGSDEAIAMLQQAGCDVRVRMAPTYYRAVYGLPVLFGLFNKYEGLEGIRVFLENSMQCLSTSRNGQRS
jgi:hypothetical protein